MGVDINVFYIYRKNCLYFGDILSMYGIVRICGGLICLDFVGFFIILIIR